MLLNEEMDPINDKITPKAANQLQNVSMAAPIVTQPRVPTQPSVPVAVPHQYGLVRCMPVYTPNCPPGLEYLAGIDKLQVNQSLDLLKVCTAFEFVNEYKIKSAVGDYVCSAKEDTSCCNRHYCNVLRSFDIEIVDNTKKRVLHFSRPLRCQSCCFPCCLQEMEVTASTGVIGYVVQNWSFWTPKFSIKNQNGETVLKIVGPCLTFATCCSEAVFKIFSNDGTQIGQINKQWSGVEVELFTDADNFDVTFPMDLDVRMKATLLGVLLLIDYMYFERIPGILPYSLILPCGLALIGAAL